MIIFKQQLKLILLLVFITVFTNLSSQDREQDQIIYKQKTYQLFPFGFSEKPDIPSPYKSGENLEIITAYSNNKDQFYLIPLTIEKDNSFSYMEGQLSGRGIKFRPDSNDFLLLALSGLHSEIELDQARTITRRSLSEITHDGRPESSSGSGFMAADEDIISVLKGDNRLVKKMGLTHPQVVRPLIHFWNIILKRDEYNKSTKESTDIEYIIYNNRKIFLKWGGRGYQESIFNDSILGDYHLEMWRDLDEEEISIINSEYDLLSQEEIADLKNRLTHIHTGEMVPYYVVHYGFYEGHTEYRADPVSLSFIFGLKSLEEINKVFKGDLYGVFNRHFTDKSFKEDQ